MHLLVLSGKELQLNNVKMTECLSPLSALACVCIKCVFVSDLLVAFAVWITLLVGVTIAVSVVSHFFTVAASDAL